MKTPFDIVRAVISAFTAALNADSKEAAEKAQIEIDDLKAQLAGAKREPDSHGIPLTPDEQAHLHAVLTAASSAPAIIVPPQPVAPNYFEPSRAPEPLEPDHYPSIPAEATGAQQEQVAPLPTSHEPQKPLIDTFASEQP